MREQADETEIQHLKKLSEKSHGSMTSSSNASKMASYLSYDHTDIARARCIVNRDERLFSSENHTSTKCEEERPSLTEKY